MSQRRQGARFGTIFYRASPHRGKRRLRRLGPLAFLALVAAVEAQGQAAPPRARPCAASDAPQGQRLLVTVTGARRAAGNITVTLYGARREDFLGRGGRLARQRIPLPSGATAAEACFALSAPGDYALAVYHDENNDHDFNRTAIGLPAEGYGFSNDAPTTLGLPEFDQVRFTLPPGESRMTVRLRY